MGKYEVTQAQWKQVVGAFLGKLTAGEGDDFPVYAVNFAEAEEFCRKLTDWLVHPGSCRRGGNSVFPQRRSGSIPVGPGPRQRRRSATR